ncbi:MAG: stimulus-sensing domain-containing protein [Bauldia sp.]
MTAGTDVDLPELDEGAKPVAGGPVRQAAAAVWRFVSLHAFSSLTRRIVVLNLGALALLLSGILYLNQFRAGLIDARIAALTTQGQIIASAIAASAIRDPVEMPAIDPERLLELQTGQSVSPFDLKSDELDFPINPERVAPILTSLVTPTRSRARVYDRDGTMLVDSASLYKRGGIVALNLDPPRPAGENKSWTDQLWTRFKGLFQGNLPLYRELGAENGKGYPEIVGAIAGQPSSIVRMTERSELILSVAVPVQKYLAVAGALLMTTEGGDIDAIVTAERLAMLRVFVVAAGVTLLLSVLLAGTIATPLRRLAEAADRVRLGVTGRRQIPDFAERRDEIGHLGQALTEMTRTLYRRMDAIESFAADVSHELKNPLTSLRSAVETLPLARTEDAKKRLTAIIQHDVRRLDRLISDIANASRLDAELARQDAAPVDVAKLLGGLVQLARGSTAAEGPRIALDVAHSANDYAVLGHDGRLGQVFNNLIDNARSFCRKDGVVRVVLRRGDGSVEVLVEDDGPGIRPDQLERVFERFYTDRPESDGFGQNSGLGLSISKQIVEAHRGRIWAENRTRPGKSGEPAVLGARFTVRLPAIQ